MAYTAAARLLETNLEPGVARSARNLGGTTMSTTTALTSKLQGRIRIETAAKRVRA
jgi:hypothetical protein